MTTTRRSAGAIRRMGSLRLCAAFAAAGLVLAFSTMGPSAAFAQTGAQQPAAKQKPKSQKQKTSADRNTQPRPETARREPKGFLDTIREGPRLTTTPPEAADWVRASRPDPNSAPAPSAAPRRRLLTPDEIRSREAALESARTRHDRIAGRKPPTGKFGSAAGKPESVEDQKRKAGCVLTCSTPIGVPPTRRW